MPGRQSSPPTADHVAIGQIVAPHGIKGGLKVKVLTDFPERFDAGSMVWVASEERKITRSRVNGLQATISVEGISDRNAAEDLKWDYITVPSADIPELEEDEFFSRDLIGLTVHTVGGKNLGLVTDVLPNPAHDILVIGEIMIPVVKEFVKEIDLENGLIKVEVIPGMVPEDEE